jgi:O-antigen/teichoic acid export membrane protein
MSTGPESLRRYAAQDAQGLLRRIVLGVTSQFTTLAAGILRNFAIVPFFLATHGVDGYADWVKLMGTAMLLQAVGMDQHIYYSYRIRTCRAARDDAGMNRTLAQGNAFYLLLSVALVAAGALLLTVVDVTALLNLSVLDRVEATTVLALLFASLFGQQYREFLRGVYIAYGELARLEFTHSLALVLLGAALIGALLLDASMVVLALIHIAVIPGVVVALCVWDFRRYREVRWGLEPGWPALTRERRNSLVAHAIPGLADRVLISGPTVMIGMFGLPSATVVQFHLTRAATRIFRGQRIAVVFAVELARQRTQGDRAGFRHLFRRSALTLGLFGGGLFGAMMGLWDLFLPWWTNGKITAEMALAALMVGETAIVVFGQQSAALLRFGGHVPDFARCQLAAAVALVAAGAPALAFGGIYPLLVIMLLASLVFLYVWPYRYLRRHVTAPATTALGWPLAIGIATAAAVYGALYGLRALVGL